MRSSLIAVYCIFAVFLSTMECFAQAPSLFPAPSLIEPSPEAFSINKYGLNSLSKYNGIPEISIPLHNISFDGLSIPISLSYGMAGLNPKEEASWVGLGWTLSATSVITRQINDQDDLSRANFGTPTYNGWDNGWIYTRQFLDIDHESNPFGVSSELIVDEQTRSELNSPPVSGYLPDLQPDVFTVSLFGRNLKFLLNKKNGNNSIISTTILNDLNVMVFYNEVTQNFQIVDDKGYKFEYTIRGYSRPLGSQESNELTISSWYLSSIISPSGESIYFSYDTGVKIHSVKSFIYSFSVDYNTPENTLGLFFTPESSYSISYTESEEIYLTNITYENHQIDFNIIKDRLDLENITVGKAARLASIDIRFKSSQFGPSLKKNISFSSSYFNSLHIDDVPDKTKWLRLKLDNIKVNGEVYSFDYNSVEALPHKETKGIDFWGFYNGKNNEVLWPSYVVNFPPSCNNCRVLNGAKREADPLYSQIAVLNKITYPTTGYTKYYFEGNVAQFLDNEIYSWEDNPSLEPLGSFRNKIVGGLRIKKIEDFDFDHSVKRIKEFSYLMSDNSNTSGLLANYNLSFVQKRIRFIGQVDTSSGTSSLTNGFTSFEYVSISSTPTSPYINSSKGYPVGYSRVVERLIDSKNNLNSLQSVSEYRNSKPLNTWYSFNVQAQIDKINAGWNQVLGGVTTGDYANGIEGWVQPGYVYDLENGTLTKEVFLDNNNQPIQENFYNYSKVKSGFVVAVRYLLADAYNPTTAGYGRPIDIFQNFIHEIKAFQLTNKASKIYTSTGEVLEQTTSYHYTPRWLKRSENTVNSEGNINKLIHYYPDDYNLLSTLVEKNIISIPIKIEKRLNDNLLASSVVEPNTIGLPIVVYEFNSSNPLPSVHSPDQLVTENFVTGARFTYYDNSSKVKQVINKGGVVKTYLYGYGGKYVVAEILGATHEQITALYPIDQVKLDNGEDNEGRLQELINLRQALSAAGIILNTYLVNPLIGIISKTDSNGVIQNYDYDQYGRLKTIRDTQGRILKMYTYELGD